MPRNLRIYIRTPIDIMKMTPIAPILLSMLICGFAGVTEAKVLFLGEKKQNNLVSELLEAASISKTGKSVFRPGDSSLVTIRPRG